MGSLTLQNTDMNFSITSNRLNILLLALLVLLGIGSFIYNQYLIDQILKKERASVELWAKATEYAGNLAIENTGRMLLVAANVLEQNASVSDSTIRLIRRAEANRSSQNFVVEEIILKDRYKIPTIIVNEDGEILTAKYTSGELDSTKVQEFGAINTPIEIHLGSGINAQSQFVYYGESATVQYLRYFPFIQLSLLALLLGVAFLSYRTISKSEQSNIWVGMTKEAAHQLGTPLSSLYGWVELLREEKKDEPFIERVSNGLEKDILRLRGVAARFNKIGSEPKLKSKPIGVLVNEVMDYAEHRLPQISNNVKVRRSIDDHAEAKLNPELFQWALENIVKNSMDAVKNSGKGAFVSVEMHKIENELRIDIADSGRGIEKKYHKEIFKPGYSTKKRGWGLGLSLSRRIIEEYHGGKIFVLRSELGEGTTIRVVLKMGPNK